MPCFDSRGSLLDGVHRAEWADLSNHFAQTPNRMRLMSGLQHPLELLSTAGCRTVSVYGPSGRTLLEFFQTDKQTGDPKGIIALDLREWQP